MAAFAETYKKHVLVTGGAGYIGSHTVFLLVEDGCHVTIVDNLSNSNIECVSRVRELTGKPEAIVFHEVDLLDKDALEEVFRNGPKFDSVIHFAGFKAVGESVALPLKYYHNNLTGTFYLIEIMAKYNCKRLVFSSSATVYGSAPVPIVETSTVGVGITNPYGRTKYMLEEILRDVCKADSDFGVVLLRYFNPVGAHPSGRIGEDPQGIPNNLMPFVQQVAIGRREKLTVFGNDFDTPDGTGVRDFIHVMDLAQGHLAALERIYAEDGCGAFTYNLGTGTGYSVLQMVEAMKVASGKDIPYVMGPRREGDIGACYANPQKAKDELGWEATRGLEEMCADAWRWQSNNPTGFKSAE
jgi:UDP-glucose 4-epimerase